MYRPALIARTPRCIALRLAAPAARYHLPAPVHWRLSGNGIDRAGLAATVVTVLDDLQPDQRYRFEAEGFAALDFETPPCAGLVRATDFGADPGLPDNAEPLARAVAAVPEGGTLLLPPGTWHSGPVFLKSHMTLHLAQGACLAAVARHDDWPILPARDAAGRICGSWEGRPAACHAALLTALDAENLALAGSGSLDGGGLTGDWWDWPKAERNGARRARTVHLIGCRDVTLLGLAVRNSPSWTIHPQGCTGLVAAGLTIDAPPDSPNTDGLNPESSTDVLLEGLRISTGDDCIAIKAGKRQPGDDPAAPFAPTRRVTIRHCLMERGHGGVVIGSEMSGGVEDVTIAHCEMVGTDRGLRVKTRRGRGGVVRRVFMTDVTMEGVGVALSVNAFYHCDADGHAPWVQSRAPAPVGPDTPGISDLRLQDIRLSGLRIAVAAVLGLPEAPVRGVRLRSVRVLSWDPDAVAEPPDMADGLVPLRHAGIAVDWADVATDPEDAGFGPRLSLHPLQPEVLP